MSFQSVFLTPLLSTDFWALRAPQKEVHGAIQPIGDQGKGDVGHDAAASKLRDGVDTEAAILQQRPHGNLQFFGTALDAERYKLWIIHKISSQSLLAITKITVRDDFVLTITMHRDIFKLQQA